METIDYHQLKRDLKYYNEPPTKEMIFALMKIIEEKDIQIEDLEEECSTNYKTGFDDGREEAISEMHNKLATINS